MKLDWNFQTGGDLRKKSLLRGGGMDIFLELHIIRIYQHKFTNNEQEISIPHKAAKCGFENFEFIVGERVQVNSGNSRAMSTLTFLLFKLNTLEKKLVKV